MSARPASPLQTSCRRAVETNLILKGGCPASKILKRKRHAGGHQPCQQSQSRSVRGGKIFASTPGHQGQPLFDFLTFYATYMAACKLLKGRPSPGELQSPIGILVKMLAAAAAT
ncbi:hypothetical protein VFPFJ_07732 [Purpureocillium lilacinum]|uniref:Uncharacterized protein n=1 Tax=Purpureocillium lilacinum TaxID=33203 RepID=A0A179H716_PURLI|nr:hypothetical protein VFPFJ_07732 [Purpureocillium lilacinum]OAQ85343.1 hypothetical protein VFPFJ_07732 [Purpureocillium lilacinum]